MRRTQSQGTSVKKPNRKKKDYFSEDVNGFLEYLQQNGQKLPRTDKGQREEQEIKEEVETALKKDQRRENRRIKRQTDKKTKMVNTGFRLLKYLLESYFNCILKGMPQ